jgi:thioredoxin-related protein
MMDRQTFGDSLVAAYLNKNYYPVKFNAEQREPVTINGKTYVLRTEYASQRSPGTHELALALLLDENNPQIGYPSTVYLDEKGQRLQTISGMLPPDVIMPILAFFAGNYYAKMPWDDYEKNVWLPALREQRRGL